MKYLAWALLAGLATGPAMAVPDSFIWLNVSVKFVVDPATGQPPAGTDDANLRQVFELMNRWLANTWRGYRVRLVDLDGSGNFRRIGGLNDTTGPSKWYNLDLKGLGEPSATNNFNFEIAATANPILYGWNSAALNLYINNGEFSSAQGPPRGLVISAYGLISDDSSPELYKINNYKIAGNLLHEMGHYFGLPHTWDDTLSDAAPDVVAGGGRDETTVRNGIAAVAYGAGQTYVGRSPAEQRLIDNTANNAMSYYQLFYDDPAQGKTLTDAERFGPTRFLFTERQMDKWGDFANNQRLPVASGKVVFVDWTVPASGTGTSASPIKTLANAITSAAGAAGNDILLLRAGTYTAATISKPLTIRATRSGAVQIQKP